MVSINTNLQSLLVQKNLAQSTNALNNAIERMTTGFKLNGAKDNAANYSIAQSMVSKLSSYDVAADNISSGLDMLKTAQDTISLMQTKGERLMSLWTQAQNGTYGSQSLSAINAEANAIVQEINRLYSNTEYNGIDLFNGIQLPDWAQEVKANAGVNSGSVSVEYNGFIADPKTYTDSQVSAMNSLSSVSESSTISSGTYKISSKAELKQLATMVNSGNITGGTFVLANDIDLEGEEWTAIGTQAKQFKGTFDGNGHTISNLKIYKPTEDFQGLFGYAAGGSTIKNVGLKEVDVKGKNFTGGLTGRADGNIENSYATGSVTGQDNTGGLAGQAYSITNSYATGTVTGQGNNTGGLVGSESLLGGITNSYATGTVTGQGNNTGGLVGSESLLGGITNSYATGNVTGQGSSTGGLVGSANGSTTNSYATGSVTGQDNTGGLAGYARSITNSYATGNVAGTSWVGGLAGKIQQVSGTNNIANGLSYSKVSGTDKVGSLVGGVVSTSNGTNFATITFTGCQAIEQGIQTVGGEYINTSGDPEVSHGIDTWLEAIESFVGDMSESTLQVGINGDTSSQISVSTGVSLNLNIGDISSSGAYDTIKSFLDQLSTKATELGAASNRLESALESTMVSIENITSSLSTIRDADIAKVSSEYIKSQILQQASATLLATANQTPSIALQLI